MSSSDLASHTHPALIPNCLSPRVSPRCRTARLGQLVLAEVSFFFLKKKEKIKSCENSLRVFCLAEGLRAGGGQSLSSTSGAVLEVPELCAVLGAGMLSMVRGAGRAGG